MIVPLVIEEAVSIKIGKGTRLTLLLHRVQLYLSGRLTMYM